LVTYVTYHLIYLFSSKCFWRWCCITAIYCLDFLHRLVSQPQCFEGWLFPRRQVYLLWWVWSMEIASVGGHWVLSTLAIHSSCAKIWLWVTKWNNIKIILALLPRYRTCGEWDKISVPQMRQ
jgi:hypothetical protein